MNPIILAFLLQFGCTPTARVVEAPSMLPVGLYQDGVVYVRSLARTDALVHELFHDCQYQRHGRAVDSIEWFEREQAARRVELAWRQRDK